MSDFSARKPARKIAAELNENGALTDIHRRTGPTCPAWRDLQWQMAAL